MAIPTGPDEMRHGGLLRFDTVDLTIEMPLQPTTTNPGTRRPTTSWHQSQAGSRDLMTAADAPLGSRMAGYAVRQAARVRRRDFQCDHQRVSHTPQGPAASSCVHGCWCSPAARICSAQLPFNLQELARCVQHAFGLSACVGEREGGRERTGWRENHRWWWWVDCPCRQTILTAG